MLRLLPLVVLFAGCSLVRTPLIDPPDTGGIDAGVDAPIVERDVPEGFDGGVDAGIDAGMRDTGGMDTGMPDTGVDSGMPDTGVDSGMPDTGVDAGMRDTGVDAPTRRSCTDLFGRVAGFALCIESDPSCEFYVNLGGSRSCADVCGAVAGSSCLGSFNESGSTSTCPRQNDVDQGCNGDANDRICRCVRVP
jgi:hypothetical protein